MIKPLILSCGFFNLLLKFCHAVGGRSQLLQLGSCIAQLLRLSTIRARNNTEGKGSNEATSLHCSHCHSSLTSCLHLSRSPIISFTCASAASAAAFAAASSFSIALSCKQPHKQHTIAIGSVCPHCKEAMSCQRAYLAVRILLRIFHFLVPLLFFVFPFPLLNLKLFLNFFPCTTLQP